MKLLTNWFSPFCRKVALALEHKGLPCEFVDGLHHAGAAELRSLNLRGEVPVLVDQGIIVVNSADILAYLDHRYPDCPVYPADPAERVAARSVERLADGRLDAILVANSLWRWARRDDARPAGMAEAAQRDLDATFGEIETALSRSVGPLLFGAAPTAAEFALWPHLSAVRPLGFILDEGQFPRTATLLAHLDAQPAFRADAARTRAFLKTMQPDTHELTRIFWRGERLEWVLARGFHHWFLGEIEGDRVLWPY